MIKKLKGLEITPTDIKHANKILKTRIPKKIYNDIKDITTIEELGKYYKIPDCTINLIIADDWYLLYKSDEKFIDLLEWYALEKCKNKMKRAIEMLEVFKEILIANKNKIFYAETIHSTSFKLYSLMLEKGLLEETSHYCQFIDFAYDLIPEVIEEIDSLTNSLTLVTYLESEDAKKYEKYFYFFVHNITFKPTELFFEKYDSKSLKKTK